jgi:DNA repair protein RecN (Recombination protein N)
VLERISIRDFAVARDVVIEPGPGLNVFTGETGAGKSLVVDALAFLFGARKGREVVASGAERSTIAGELRDAGAPVRVERGISAAGRSSARIDGETATVDALLELGRRLVDIHGQSEHLAILRPAAQLAALDAFGGLDGDRDAFSAGVRELRTVRRELRDLTADVRERERLIGQLTFEVDEITSAGLVPGEDETLHAERQRLGSIARLIEHAAAAQAALDAAPLSEVVASVQELESRDAAAEGLAALGDTLELTANDLRRALRAYADTLEEDPARLAEVEERLDRIARLRRKYGETVDQVITYGEEAARRLETLSSSEERIEGLRERELSLVAKLAALGEALSTARRGAASRLCEGIRAELAHLGMGNAALAIGFATEDAPDGLPVALPDYEIASGESAPAGETLSRAFGESGVDRVEFLASFNPGESPRPLSAVASGGETSRFLLALTAVLGAAASPRTIVFDEVDEGVGGRAGSLVGEALARLAGRHQVLCVTHLPQVAAFASRHFVVAKASDGAGTWSVVGQVEGEDRVAELAAMLGGVSDATLATARELLSRAR